MGRPPHSGVPVFRFTQAEVAEMEACLRDVNNAMPSRETIGALAEKFSASAERAGKIAIQSKQVWNWFQNRRYAQRTKMIKANVKSNMSPTHREDSIPSRTVASTLAVAPERSHSDTSQMEFEARSARDGAWYDVATFLSHRICDNGEPEVKIRFTCFENDDEWINIRKCVRLRSLPCEPSECVVVLPGDLILCFQEGKDHALYFDAHVLDAQRRRHDVRGCRCRFLVRYDHDQSEEIVPLRKICRRPETDHRLQKLQTLKTASSLDMQTEDASCVGSSKGSGVKEHKPSKLHTDEVIAPTQSFKETVTVAIAPAEAKTNSTAVDFPPSDVVVVTGGSGNILNDTSMKTNG